MQAAFITGVRAVLVCSFCPSVGVGHRVRSSCMDTTRPGNRILAAEPLNSENTSSMKEWTWCKSSIQVEHHTTSAPSLPRLKGQGLHHLAVHQTRTCHLIALLHGLDQTLVLYVVENGTSHQIYYLANFGALKAVKTFSPSLHLQHQVTAVRVQVARRVGPLCADP